MVERTAFTQLRYSIWLLLATTFVMLLVFWFPWAGLLSSSLAVRSFALVGVCAMMLSYLPTLRYYRRSILWAPTPPVDRRLVSSDDMVVCPALLARKTIGVERPRLRPVNSRPDQDGKRDASPDVE